MPFEIIRNDITLVHADAVVNTANPLPVVGQGTDCAIHAAAGPALLAARKEIGEIAVGCAAATPAFDLPARYVLHTVSPAWVDGEHGEAALLRRAYDAALSLADELGCASVAFPLMGAGSYAFPKDVALSVAIAAVTDHLMDHERQIWLVLFNTEAFDLAGSLFADLKSYIDDNYAEEKRREESAVFEAAYTNRPRLSARRPRRKTAREVASDLFSLAEADSSLPAAGSSLDDVLRSRESTFSEYLLDLLRERTGKDSEVYKRAEISRQLFSKILNNKEYQPTKNTAIQLAIGLELDMDGTQKLLNKAGYSLTRSSRADLVVQYYIERKMYCVPLINAALDDCRLPLLKTGLKA